MKNIEPTVVTRHYSHVPSTGGRPVSDHRDANRPSPPQRHDLEFERATLVHTTRQLRLALHDAWTRAQQQSTPETYLAATLQFSDLDMIRCLEAANRLYRKSLSQVASAIIAWKSSFNQVSEEIVEELQANNVPIECVHRMIHGQSWHQDAATRKEHPQESELGWLRQGGNYLAQMLEQLQRVEDALGHDCHLRWAYR